MQGTIEREGIAGIHPAHGVSPVRVCFLIDRLSRAGTESQLLSLLQHLDRQRVQPYLCMIRGRDPESKALEPSHCPVFHFPVPKLARPGALWQAWRFARFLRQECIDVVQAYFPDSSYFGVPAARLAGVPHVLRTRFNLGYWMKPRNLWLGRIMGQLATGTVANCEACRRAALDDDWLAPPTVSVIPNGVELQPYEKATPLPTHNRSPRIGMVANLRWVKNPELLLRAAQLLVYRHPSARFEIFGEGELRPTLQNLIIEMQLQDRFILRGKHTNVPEFLAGLDVAVLCSRSEGSSNALLEYMAAGRPIVATAVGGTAELIEHGVHGLLVPPDDVVRLADSINRLLGNRSWAAELGNTARIRVRKQHDPRVRAMRYEDLYERLTGKTAITVDRKLAA